MTRISTISIFFIAITLIRAGNSLNFVFLHEHQQKEFASAIDEIMKELQLKYSNIEINYLKIPIEKQKSTAEIILNQICATNHEVSLFIDGTISGFDEVREKLEAFKVPYFNFDYTIQSVVKVLEIFLIQRNALNVLLIVPDEKVKDEVLRYNLKSDSPLRFLVLNQPIANIAQTLKSIRPLPEFFTIIADSDKTLKRILHDANKEGLFTLHSHSQRWIFMLLEHSEEKYEKYTEMKHRLMLSHDICCNPKCICTSHNMIKIEALRNFLQQSVESFVGNNSNAMQTRILCDENEDNSTLFDETNIVDVLMKRINNNEWTYSDNSINVWQNLKFDVVTTMSLSTDSTDKGDDNVRGHRVIATVDKTGLKLMNETEHFDTLPRFFRIGVTESIPYTYYKRNKITNEILRDNNGNTIYEGYCIDFIAELSKRMNFTYELVEPESGKFGEKDSRGIFDGLIGDLEQGKIDFVVAAMKITADREEVIDFIIPYFDETGILIVMKKPIPDHSLFKFMSVLRLEVWLSILGALCATAIVIWLLDIFSPYSARNWNYNENCRKFTLRESFWFALTSFTPQGGGEAPKSISGRVIVGAYWLFVVLMLATFTANLAAFLTVERMQAPVQSLDQLARQSRINYTVVRDSDTHQYFKNMKFSEDFIFELWKNATLGGDGSNSDGIKFRIWDYPVKEQFGQILMAIERTQPVTNSLKGFNIVNQRESNDFAFIHDANEIKYAASKNCNFSIVGEVFAEQPYAVAVQQGSLLAEDLSKAILTMQKERFFDDLKAKYWNNSASCREDDDSEGITLESLGGIFIASIVGLVIAMLVLVVEVFYYRKKTTKTTKIELVSDEKDEKDVKIFTTRIYPFEMNSDKQSVLLGPGHFIPVDFNAKRKTRFSPLTTVRTRD